MMKLCADCGHEKPLEDFFKNRARRDGVSAYCKVHQAARNAATAAKVRLAVIELLGGPICIRCGFNDVRALTIDHKHGGGTEHRRRSSPRAVLRHAEQNPDEYQVLCWNCNYIKRLENGENSSTSYREAVIAMHDDKITEAITLG